MIMSKHEDYADRVIAQAMMTVNGGLDIEAASNAVNHAVKALELQEAAEEAHANCDECGGEEVPELCPVCFPLYDDARIARRLILARVGSPPTGERT